MVCGRGAGSDLSGPAEHVAEQRLPFMRQIQRWRQPCSVRVSGDRQPSGERSSLVMAGRRADPRATAAEVEVLHDWRGTVEQMIRGTIQTLASAASSS